MKKSKLVVGLNLNGERAGLMMDLIGEMVTVAFGYGKVILDFEHANIGHSSAAVIERDGIEQIAAEAVIEGALERL